MEPIGASLVESLVANHQLEPQTQLQEQEQQPQLPSRSDDENDNHANENTTDESATVSPPPPLIPFPSRYNHESLLLSAIPKRSLNGRHRRRRDCLLVKGPEKSGRTSLMMDLALSLASKTPCRCNATQRSDDVEDGGAFECHCVAVTLFRPAVAITPPEAATTDNYHQSGDERLHHIEHNEGDENMDEYDTEEFPLLCHKLHGHSKSSSSTTTTTTTTTTAMDTETDTRANSDSNMDSGSHDQNAFQKEETLLSRIQVYHVTSARQILSYLIQVQGFPREEQPWGGILIDDLHCFSSSSSSSGSSNNIADYNVVLLSQIVALLADTASWLETQQTGTSPPTIAVSLLDHAISNKWTDHFWSTLFLPEIVTIVPSTHRSPHDWHQDLTTAQQKQQQQQDADWLLRGRDQSQSAATAVANIVLTPTTPITSWSLQVHPQQQQNHSHSYTRRQRVRAEYAIIMQDDDYNVGGASNGQQEGCIVWKCAANDEDENNGNSRN